MMTPKQSFEFLNSPVWLDYSHKRYLDHEEIKRRLPNSKTTAEALKNIILMRKLGSVPIFLDSLQVKFWYFPSDAIQQKLIHIERLGVQLYDKIAKDHSYRSEFLQDAATEEAITSAIYEGANTTRTEAKQLLESGKKPRSKDEWMLLNNYEAMTWIKAHHKEPVTPELLQKIHQIVTKNTLDTEDAQFCGKFRNSKVFVNNKLGKTVHEGVDSKRIGAALTEAIEVVESHARYLHPLIKGILLHYLVAYIHPFFDGNGRAARTLFYFTAMKHEQKFVELLSISAHLKNSGNQYERAFQRAKDHDWDLTYFIDYCLESLLAALKIVDKKVQLLLSISALELSETQTGLLQRLALNRFAEITAESHAKRIDCSREHARKDLKTLAKLGYLDEKLISRKFIYKINIKKLKQNLGQK